MGLRTNKKTSLKQEKRHAVPLCCAKNVLATSEHSLTHFISLFYFYGVESIGKLEISSRFQGYRNGTYGRKWLRKYKMLEIQFKIYSMFYLQVNH